VCPYNRRCPFSEIIALLGQEEVRGRRSEGGTQENVVIELPIATSKHHRAPVCSPNPALLLAPGLRS
jgi:hypothetical protein